MKTIYIGRPMFTDWLPGVRSLAGNLKDCKILPLRYETMSQAQAQAHGLILPLSLADMLKCNDLGLRSFCPDTATIELLDNKLAFILWMKGHDLAQYVPDLYESFIDGTHTVYKTPIYPCIEKRTQSVAGTGSRVIMRQEDRDKDRDRPMAGPNTILQRYIASPDEYTGHLCVKDGRILDVVYFASHKSDAQALTYITHGRITGYSVLEATDMPSGTALVFESIFRALNYTGFACVDFKVDTASGTPLIFEINPRMGGSLACHKVLLQRMVSHLLGLI